MEVKEENIGRQSEILRYLYLFLKERAYIITELQ